VEKDIAAWFEKYYTIRFRNYPVSPDYLHEATQIDCRT
jgi:formylmethanofuran dehydrogenase subunit A